MTGLITKAALFTACGMIVAAAAMAGVPSAATSTSPSFLRLVTSIGGTAPDSLSGKFTITVNDISHNPVAGSNVVVDFSGCVTTAALDIRVASNQQNVNYTTNCTTHAVSAYTNASGVVAFTLLGSSTASPAGFSTLGCARIYADGVLLSSPTAATADINGSGNVSGGDISVLLTDIGVAANTSFKRGRSDLSGDGNITGGDISVLLTIIGRNAPAGSIVGALCP